MLWGKKPKDQPDTARNQSGDDAPYRWDDSQWTAPPYKHWEAGNSDYEADERNFWRHQVWALWTNVGIGVITLVFAGTAAVIAYRAYNSTVEAVIEARKQTAEAHRQADAAVAQIAIAKDTAQRDLRAYVSLAVSDFLFPEERKDETGKLIQKPDRRGIVLNVVNSGKTWAQNLIVRKKSFPAKGDVDHWKEVEWDKLTEEPLVLGPGQHFGLQLGDILISDMPSIAAETKGVHYYVWITYDDVFGTKPSPKTQIAVRVNADLAGAYGHLSYGFLPPHNCADEYCPD